MPTIPKKGECHHIRQHSPCIYSLFNLFRLDISLRLQCLCAKNSTTCSQIGALHTAAIVQDHLDLPIRVEPLIGERRLFSCDTGTPTSHLKPRWRGADFSALTIEEWWPEADESAASLQTRLTAFHAKWGGKGARVLFVSHALFMMAATGVPAKNAQIVHLPDGE